MEVESSVTLSSPKQSNVASSSIPLPGAHNTDVAFAK
jgi:hypothetical protein